MGNDVKNMRLLKSYTSLTLKWFCPLSRAVMHDEFALSNYTHQSVKILHPIFLDQIDCHCLIYFIKNTDVCMHLVAVAV